MDKIRGKKSWNGCRIIYYPCSSLVKHLSLCADIALLVVVFDPIQIVTQISSLIPLFLFCTDDIVFHSTLISKVFPNIKVFLFCFIVVVLIVV